MDLTEVVDFLRIATDMTAKSTNIHITREMKDVITGEEIEDYFETISFNRVLYYLKSLTEYKIHKRAWEIIATLYEHSDDEEVNLPVELTREIEHYHKKEDYTEDAKLHSYPAKELLQYITDIIE